MKAKTESKETEIEELADKLAFIEPSPLDLVDPRRYADYDSYIDAVVKLELERSSPEYKAARQRVVSELKKRAEREKRERQSAQYKAIRERTDLNSVEKSAIRSRAIDLTLIDFRAERICAADLPKVISEYAQALTEEALHDKAINELYADALRAAARQVNL